ncbi:target of Myb1 membrane trafficking protein isoform X2 [Uranotaenia lowii]|uniref:target of Myb1 membrane trafficking protein isoform X2 n=1 Tax=Uranotaenia lowii TaxID=190385 RepID=UPI002479C42D|nr:target of Myb1 membrane trafficking protein isoform X2 [Uranotaenia lowii]
MTSFFNVGALGGNPFSTPVGQRIEQATDASLASENWALNMEICDMINESSDGPRDAMKAIRKRLTQNAGKNHTVIMYTLTVLETCVKNCGKPFHVLVANKEFIQELVKLIGPKNDPPPIVQEKVLSLIQIWADAFRSQSDLNGVVLVYQELKNKGIEFPATDLDSLAPIYTPQRSVPDGAATESSISPHHASQTPGSPAMPPPSSMSQDQIAKLQSELDIVTMNMTVLGDMLTELQPGQESPSDYLLLTDLVSTCREMQNRIVELIGKVSHDELTAELLRLNDELNNLFLRHARFEKNRDPNSAASNTPSAILGAAMGVPPGGTEKPGPGAGDKKESLIDLDDEAAAGGLSSQLAGLNLGGASTTTSQISQLNTVSAQSGGTAGGPINKPRAANPPDVVTDEFDIFAQSRNTTGDTKDTAPVDLLGQAKPTSMNTRDAEFDEMEQWLENSHDDLEKASGNGGSSANGSGGTGPGLEESLTSKEFEKFLAERAAVADNLPTISSQIGSGAGTGGQQQQQSGAKSDRKKKDDDGLLAL